MAVETPAFPNFATGSSSPFSNSCNDNNQNQGISSTDSPACGCRSSDTALFDGQLNSLYVSPLSGNLWKFKGTTEVPLVSTGTSDLQPIIEGEALAYKTTFYDGNEQSESTAAVKVQKVYRSYRTRRRLADSVVFAEELWGQALDFARLNRSTISFFNLPESPASRWIRVGLNAAKVGKGLSKDAKAQKLAFQHWIEAIDPRHRYGHNLHLYFEEWCKADAGQPFFYWLDIGDGKELDLKECSRSKLRQQSIKYLGPLERENYEYTVVDGKVIHQQSGDFLDTYKENKERKWIFVMSTSEKLYAGEKKKGVFHHSSFLAGGATLAAGRLIAQDGILKSISAYSGHYRPTDESLDIFLSFLEINGVDLDEVEIHRANEDSEVYYDEGNSSGNLSTMLEVLASSIPPEPKIINEEVSQSNEKVKQTETKGEYKRTLSGGLQSPRADVSKQTMLQRINSKKAAKSYQLGHQLSHTWSTGAGPRIGCVADYPVELRLQALEFVDLSPKTPPTPSSTYRKFNDIPSPTAQPILVSPSSYRKTTHLSSLTDSAILD